MLRLLSAALTAILITLPSIAALAADKDGGSDRSWQSLHSVVSYRGVRGNQVQPAAASNAAAVAPDAADFPELDLVAVPGPAPAEAPAPAAAEAPVPGAAAVPAPAAAAVAIPKTAEVPVLVQPAIPDTDPVVPAVPAPAERETPSPVDAVPLAPAVVESPDACGPVRARIGDLSLPNEAPLTVDAPAPEAAPLPDEATLPAVVPVPDGVRPVKDASAQKSGGGIAGGRGGVLGRGQGVAGGVAGGTCGSCGGLRGRRAGGGDACGGCGAGGLLGRGAGSNWCWCEMPQHYSYYPEMHGYYYFRLYNGTMIPGHLRTATQWGENPNDPWGNQVFEQVYADYLAEKNAAAANGGTDPFVESGDAVVPPPVDDN